MTLSHQILFYTIFFIQLDIFILIFNSLFKLEIFICEYHETLSYLPLISFTQIPTKYSSTHSPFNVFLFSYTLQSPVIAAYICICVWLSTIALESYQYSQPQKGIIFSTPVTIHCQVLCNKGWSLEICFI